ncbi:cobalamin biosynthesis protein CbiD [Carboxylicivirga sp. A043]|uniref:cobalt-precorrin-5B (C(1))-methyltransferase CbiD n=1 Tax=Carboxylicivirga litoralis TaxID=2816963 RepID=UPI0021CB16DE|nr:cobalt-precorrin-5B (C(1))-methyltransferase CbiD [Carboxylicivirga sp. A043]MCU4155666.1 cobalamin biosynthesis protein CbiD [Carboxylicivirga sp. A043]
MSKPTNILLFGGTTEGKATANWLNDMGFAYFYSTKTPTNFKVHKGSQKMEGALSREAMISFCKTHQIDCVIDAAHPYAHELHWTIHHCCQAVGVEHVRIERELTDKVKCDHVIYLSSLDKMVEYCRENDYKRILSLMGVKSVARLHQGLDDKEVWYRILDRALSWDEALSAGVKKEQVLASLNLESLDDAEHLIQDNNIEALLTKDSGFNGLFDQKVELSKTYNIPLLVLERPVMPSFHHLIKCRADLRKYMCAHYTLPKAELAHGYTTGTCGTICAKAAASRLLSGFIADKVQVFLPDGEVVSMPIHSSGGDKNEAFATVIKNSGDDPDLTDGLVIGCRIKLNEAGLIRFVSGEGVGIVRLPGLRLPIGEPAINKVPRQMIMGELQQLLDEYDMSHQGMDVQVYIPQGRRLAEKTFNPRLGVEGGLSIIGSTGRIKPFSSAAYVNSIKRQLGVVQENRASHIVLNSGGRSERYLKRRFNHLPGYCFVQYGNYIGEALKAANECGIQQVTMGVMIGKAVKLAAGHLDTHSRKVVMDKDFIMQMANESGCSAVIVKQIGTITMARELEELLPFEAGEPFFKLLKEKCYQVAADVVEGFKLDLILINNEGKMI